MPSSELMLLFCSLQILDVTAIVLANLCVAYIMTQMNADAEDLMRQIEKEEERLQSLVFLIYRDSLQFVAVIISLCCRYAHISY